MQAERRGREASRRFVEATAELLESPPVSEGVKGDQLHFLSRLERLDEPGRSLALRFYYDHGLTRFVARRILGLPIGPDASEPWGAEGDPPRVVLDLDAAAQPGAAVVDAAGQVVTCLAPGMGHGSTPRAAFPEVAAAVAAHERWLEQCRLAPASIESCDAGRLCLEIEDNGWFTPRETIAELAALGPAASLLVERRLRAAQRDALFVLRGCGFRAVRGSDAAIREWFRATGATCAFLAVLAETGGVPGRRDLRLLLGFSDLLVPMALGAALAHWRPYDGETWLEPEPEGDEPDLRSPLSCFTARAAYFGTLRRLAQGTSSGWRLRSRAADGLERQLEELGAAFRGWEDAGEAIRPEWEFVAELTAMAADEGELASEEEEDADPRGLPPLRLDDLVRPGGGLLLDAPRRFARRLFRDRAGDPAAWFCTRRQLRAWRERLGSPDRPRRGLFRLPFVPRLEPVRNTAPARRNDPCPCGSGRKFKRCCLDKPVSTTPPLDAAVAAVA